MTSKLNAADAVKRMKKAHGLRQPSPPMSLEDDRQVMKQGGRKLVNRAAVPPRGAFSAQMLRPPSTPTFSTDSPLEHSLRPEDDEDFSSGGYDYGFVTSRRGSNQALSPPPPPPPAPSRHPRSSIRRPMMAGTAAVSKPRSPAVQGGQTSSRNGGIWKSKQTSPGVQSVNSKNHEQPGDQSTDKPTPSVHPIDTLSKKLRQQAMELTHVYEELEKQNLQIDEYKQQVRDQKLQLEQLQAQRRKSIDGSSKTPSNSRALALEQQKRATQMMIGTPSTGASLGQKRGELERKIKEADREKKKYELAAKRIEKALVELQVFQNDRMEKLFPGGVANQRDDDADTPDDLEAVFNEQRAYIRVLEEAVHLKATDFEVTGHEELLIVLAELRHTIYEQEKDVEQKNNALSTVQEQLEQEKHLHLETKELLAAVQKQQEEMVQSFQEQESALYAQINETEGELKQRDNHLSQLEGASTDAQRAEEALQNRLAAAMKAQNLTEAKLEDAARTINALQEQLHSRATKFEEGQRQIVKLHEECTKKQAHLDELNALQEELLTSVDKYVNKVKKSRDKVERLEAELQSCKEKQMMAKAQADDASRSSSEELAALRTKISEAEQREQQVQAQFTTLQQEKTRLEFTLAEVQQSLQSQIQESSDQQQEFSTKEKKYNEVEEAVAELEAALSTALRMMLGRSAETLALSEAEGAAEMDESSTDLNEHSFLLDQAVFRDLRVCCQALDTLTTRNSPPQCTSLCPSFLQMVNRIVAIGEQVQTEMSRALSSWSRERTNLVEACAVLDSTAQMCQDEMEKRHQEICDCRQELAERTLEVEAFVMQVDTLDEQLRRAEAECEAFHALEQHAADQERVLEAKEILIRDLTAEHDRLEAVESAYSVQVSTNTRLTQQLEDQRAAMNARRTYSEELEHALESADTFAEQQNERNQQLNTQLAQVEKSNREQADHLKTLEVQTSAFSSRFLGLVKQYAAFLRPTAATDRSIQDHLNQFDVEIQNGDVLRLLQLFPALLEEYISTCSRSSEHSPLNKGHITSLSISNNKKLQRPVKWPTEKPRRVNMDTSTPANSKPSPPSSPLRLAVPVSRTPRCSNRANKEEAQLAEQLELIRGAFQSYRDDMAMDR